MKKISKLALFGALMLTLSACGGGRSKDYEVRGYKLWLKYSVPYYESIKSGDKFIEDSCSYVTITDDCKITSEMDDDTKELYGEIANNTFYKIVFYISSLKDDGETRQKKKNTKYFGYKNGRIAEIDRSDGEWFYEEAIDRIDAEEIQGYYGDIPPVLPPVEE